MNGVPENAAPLPPARRRRVAAPSIAARGEPMLWLSGGALATALAMICGLLLLVFVQGMSAFWPAPLERFALADGTTVLGAVARVETRPVADPDDPGAPPRRTTRIMVATGNFDLTGEHFRWIEEADVMERSRPDDAWAVERLAWGRFHGTPKALIEDGKVVADTPEAVMAKLEEVAPASAKLRRERERIEKRSLAALHEATETARLAVRRAELEHGPGSPEAREAEARSERARAVNEAASEPLRERIREIDAEIGRRQLAMVAADGAEKAIPLGEIVRATPANRLSFLGRLRVYLARWVEFLTEDPREANSEGGVFPAIFGTVAMTLVMTAFVAPFGVLAALYLHEYARSGFVVGALRIAINNLAGVPSIVFGVFGLGFFCYTIGAGIDSAFFAERLPSPTLGKGGLLWASLTLALLTLPVVIVAAEEALAAVPGSLREGSYACGASKWQTIRRVVLPTALPGIITGGILAMARGAGEVAPLMLVGAVKLAPELPVDGRWPFVHPERSFMHLGFHIYDLGFQSQNSEAAKPMVYATTLLLILIVALLNVAGVSLRARLRRRLQAGKF